MHAVQLTGHGGFEKLSYQEILEDAMRASGAIGGPLVELDARTLYLKYLSFFWLHPAGKTGIHPLGWLY